MKKPAKTFKLKIKKSIRPKNIKFEKNRFKVKRKKEEEESPPPLKNSI